MEQLVLSGDFYASDNEKPKLNLFEEVGVHSPRAYLRLARRTIKSHLRKFGLYYFIIALMLLMCEEIISDYSYSQMNSCNRTHVVDNSDKYDLTSDDY